MGRPFTGAWIETIRLDRQPCLIDVAPSRGRGLKLSNCTNLLRELRVAPSRGRGLKLELERAVEHESEGRPFTGAWIETTQTRR